MDIYRKAAPAGKASKAQGRIISPSIPIIQTNNKMETHNLIVDFGIHRGQRWTRLPISYLKWMVNTAHSHANIAQAELDRRGVILDSHLEITGHAIDRASLHLIKQWRDSRGANQGLHAWLYQQATDAIAAGEIEGVEKENRILNNIKFVFRFGEHFPTLVTVMNLEEKRGYQHEKA